MEAIIRTENQTLFEGLLNFLKALDITVVTRVQTVKTLPKERSKRSTTVLNEFQQLLLKGPVMSDDDYNYFREKKLDFNKWK